MKPIKGTLSSPGNGLSVKIYTNISDYLYTVLATFGTKVLISLPTDYPDTTSGNLIENIIGTGKEYSIKLFPIRTFSTTEVTKYPIEKRQCIFRNEQKTLFGGYSSSDCFMDCKIKSIEALCQCIPFNYINVFKGRRIDQCTLADLRCLSSYTRKWNTIYPRNVEEDVLSREEQDSLQCKQCYAACSDTTYSVKNEKSDLNSPNQENFSIIHVFFEKSVGILNKQDVQFYWFDILSLFGGLCSLFMGVSLISIIEIIYYFTYKLYMCIQKSKLDQ